jgi:hypothetical protein
MKKEYMTFVEDIKDLAEGQEIELTIRDLTPGPRKYDAKIVRAVVARDPSRLPDADALRVSSWVGVPYPEPWAIKVIGEVSETLAGVPHEDFIKARKGQ